MADYARSSVVYRELRAALGPWCREHGYGRQRGTDAAWTRRLDDGQDLTLSFRCSPWGSGATGGGSFYGLIQTADAATVRQCDISLCLVQAELDALRQLQTQINRRRPRTSEIDAWLREDSLLGEHMRSMYSGNETPYREGEILTFGYYGIDDVRAHADFVLRHLPDIISRFLDHRCASPRPVPQPPFFGRLMRGN